MSRSIGGARVIGESSDKTDREALEALSRGAGCGGEFDMNDE